MNRQIPYNPEFIDISATDSHKNRAGDAQIRFVITTLRKHKIHIIGLSLLVTALAALLVWSIQPTFRSTASLQFDTEGKGSVIQIDELVELDGQGAEYLQTQIEILKSEKLAQQVVMDLGLVNHWDLNKDVEIPEQFKINNIGSNVITLAKEKIIAPGVERVKAAFTKTETAVSDDAQSSGVSVDDHVLQQVVRDFRSKVRVVQAKGASIVKISFDSADPKLSADVANALGTQYLLLTENRRNSLRAEASGWLKNRLDEIKLKVDESESKLLKFREENNLLELRGQIDGFNEQQVSQITQELLSANRELAESELLITEVKAARRSGIGALSRIPSISSDPTVRGYLESVQESERILDELRNRFLEKHPKIIDAQSNLNTARGNYRQQVLNIADSIDKNYVLALSTVNSLEGQLERNRDEMQSLGWKQIGLLKLEQEVQVNRELFEKFYSREREADESRGLNQSIASFADLARSPLAPIKPNKPIILGSVMLLSLIGFGALVFGFEEYKDTIQGTHDVERKLGLNVLGILPKMQTSRNESSKSILPRTVDDPDGVFLEAVRTLYTSVRLSGNQRADNVLLVTSSVPHEGKSTTAINLALSFSRHEKTLLIEADLRRPGVAAGLSLSGPGLADILVGSKLFSSVVHRGVLGKFDVLGAGYIDVESAEYLGEEPFQSLIGILSKHYDRIIIDSPPVQAVSDALVLGEVADKTIFVVKADSTTSSSAANTVRRLQHFGQNVLGAVITQVDVKQVTAYGGDHYYQGYFDKYSYGNGSTVSRGYT